MLDVIGFLVLPTILVIIMSLFACSGGKEQKSVDELAKKASNLSFQGRWAEARDTWEDIAQQVAKFSGAQSPEYAFALSRVAICHEGLGRLQKADSLRVVSIAILAQYPPYDSLRAKVLYERAAAWMLWKNYPYAESILVESLQLSTGVCSENNPIVFLANERLADCLGAMGDFSRATSVLESVCKALCPSASVPDTNCLYPIACLAKGYLQLKRYAAAESLIQSTLDVYPNADSVSAWLTADMTLSLAVARHELRKRQMAADDFLTALRLAEKAFGYDDPALLEYLQNAAISLKGLSKYEEALHLRRRALAIMEKKYGILDTMLIPVLKGIARDLRSMNRESEAQEVDKRAKAIALPSK